MDEDKATSPLTASASARTSSPLSLVHRCWYFAVVALGLVFLFVLPPYQGADEYKHWLRAWSVTEGQIYCDEIPSAAVDARHHLRVHRRSSKFPLSKLEQALVQEPGEGMTDKFQKQACGYPAFAYIVPAIVLRTTVYFNGQIDPGDMIKAFYLGRVANWLLLCFATYWFLLAMPAFRNLGLFFLSIPEVLEQTSQFNIDGAQFAFMFILIAAALRSPTRVRVVTIVAMAVLLTMMRPVYGLFGCLALPALLDLYVAHGASLRRYLVAGLLAVILPAVFWKVWTTTNVALPAVLPDGAAPGEQLAFLRSHPLHLFEVMWNQLISLFGHNLMRGSWSSILGGFGPARVELPMAACYALLAGLVLAFSADVTSPSSRIAATPVATTARARRLSWALAMLGVAAAIPASVLAMYLFYTQVGAAAAYGVQGRYYLVGLFVLIVLGANLVRYRWPNLRLGSLRVPIPRSERSIRVRLRTILIGTAALLCIWADLVAIQALGSSYW